MPIDVLIIHCYKTVVLFVNCSGKGEYCNS